MKRIGIVLTVVGLLAAASCGSDAKKTATSTATTAAATATTAAAAGSAATTAAAGSAVTTAGSSGSTATSAGSGSTAATASTASTASASTVAAPAADAFDPNATFRYAYSVGPSSFDPSKASSSFDNVALFIAYDRLVHLSPTGEAVPGLATKWEFNADGTTLTLTLA